MADTPDVIQANSGDGAGTKFGFTEADDASYNVPWVELVMGDGLGYHWRIDSGHPLPVILGSNSGVTIGAVEQVGTWTINLPSGAATESGLTTINATLNSMYSVLTAMDVDTSAMALSLAAIETALGGTLTVGSHAVTNAGTFTVQESGAALTALQLIDNPVATISSTDVFRVAIFDDSNSQITSFGGTQYAVDAVLGSTPTGTVALAQRDDALSSLAPIEGDAVGLRVDANGALWVIPSGTVTVSGTVTANLGSLNGAATAANQSTANTYLFDIGALVDTIDGAVGDISATIGTHGSAGPTKAVSISGTDALGDCREILTDTSGRVYVNVSGTVTIADGGGSITVDATELTAIQAADEAIADGFATVAGGTPPNSMVQIGATAAGGTFHSVRTDTAGRLKIVTDTTARPQFDMYAGGVALITDASNGLLVDLGTNNDVVISDGGGSITVDGSVSISGSVAVTDGGGTLYIDDGGGSITIDGSLTTVSTVTTVSAVTALGTITGASVAHDSADSGNPHKIGMKAIAHSSNPTAVAVNDRTNWFA
ncbi:MAG: hypothetical protein KDA99_17120, partial [Planctomycetales bacterium]|nr:hypothetical protein [Planctomycetales bacterium]